MKRFGFGKKSDSDEGSGGLSFGRKKTPQAAAENPYAQSEDAYSPHSQPSMASPAVGGLPSGPRGGLPSGPRGGLPGGPRGGVNTPPPPYAGSNANSGYGNEKYGSQGGYGANRYNNASAASYNSYQSNQAIEVQQSQFRQGGYGGMGRNEQDDTRDDLLTGALPTYVDKNSASHQLNGTGSGQYGQSGQSALSGGSYGGGYGERRELTEEEKQEQELQDTKDQINQTRDESLQSSQRTLAIGEQTLAGALGTYQMIGQQGERLANMQKHLDEAAFQTKQADAATRNLQKANGSMWNPNNYMGKKAKERDEEAVKSRAALKREREDATRKAAYEDKMQFMRGQQEIMKSHQQQGLGRTGGRTTDTKYTFEDDDEQDGGVQRQKEEEINDNLDKISNVVGQLRLVAGGIGNMLDTQNQRMPAMEDTVGDIHNEVTGLNTRLRHIR